MHLLALLLASLISPADTTRTYMVPVAEAESLSVTEIGSGQPVVFIPGLFGSAYSFRHVLPLLAERGYRAIVVEPLGIGYSSRPQKVDYSLAAQAGRVAVALRKIDATGVVIAGHSIGAAIAYRVAIVDTGLVRALISIEGGPAETAVTPSAKAAMRFIPWVKWLGGMKLIRSRIRKGLMETAGDTSWITDEVVQGYTAGAAVNIDRTLKAMLAMANAKEPEMLKPRLPEIHVPLLVLKGSVSRSGVPPEEVQVLAEAITAFRMDTVPGSGLYIQEERPTAIVDAVDNVLALGLRLEPSREAAGGVQ